MAKLNPYLTFDNNCREAMNFYKDCLGGELTIQTVGEMPEMAAQMPPDMHNKILHSHLISGNMELMASDLSRTKIVKGNNNHLCIQCTSDREIEEFFAKLSAGGTVVDPLADMPWGGRFGSLTDKFGMDWIFNFQKS